MALPTIRRGFDPSRAIAQRREEEHRRRSAWEANAGYFASQRAANPKYEKWGSFSSFRQSMESYKKEQEKDDRKSDLVARRAQLQLLFQQERDLWTQMLQEMQPTKQERVSAMRQQTSILKTARESRRQEVAQTKANEAFLLSNPDIRSIDSERFRKHVEEEREAQLEEQRRAEERRASEEAEYLRLRLEEAREAEARERVRESERQRKTEDHLSGLQKQVEELRLKEEEAEQLRLEQEAILIEQDRIHREEKERERKEELERKARYSRTLHTQHKAQLLRKSREIQEALEADLRLLQDLAAAERAEQDIRTERRHQAKADIEWMREEAARQLEYERQRTEDLDRLTHMEAARLQAKQEEQWDREKRARQRLMAEVFEERREQLRERLDQIKERQAESIREREALLDDIEESKAQTQRETQRKEQTTHLQKHVLEEQVASRRHEEETRRRREADELERERRAQIEYQESLRRARDERLASPFRPPSFGRRKVAWD